MNKEIKFMRHMMFIGALIQAIVSLAIAYILVSVVDVSHSVQVAIWIIAGLVSLWGLGIAFASAKVMKSAE